jgi:hypothetical protein
VIAILLILSPPVRLQFRSFSSHAGPLHTFTEIIVDLRFHSSTWRLISVAITAYGCCCFQLRALCTHADCIRSAEPNHQSFRSSDENLRTYTLPITRISNDHPFRHLTEPWPPYQSLANRLHQICRFDSPSTSSAACTRFRCRLPLRFRCRWILRFQFRSS